MEEHSNFYTVAELAQLAGCRAQMIYNYLHKGRLPHVYDKRYLIPRVEADKWLGSYTQRTEARRNNDESTSTHTR